MRRSFNSDKCGRVAHQRLYSSASRLLLLRSDDLECDFFAFQTSSSPCQPLGDLSPVAVLCSRVLTMLPPVAESFDNAALSQDHSRLVLEIETLLLAAPSLSEIPQ